MNMNMQKNSYLDDYSEETINQLFLVSKEILNKAELSIEVAPFYDKGSVWFSPLAHEGINSELIINKLAKLQVVSILDQNFQNVPIPHISAYKIEINLSTLRDFVKDLELRIRSKTQKEEFSSNVSWPDYYKWDNSGHDFLVADGKKLSFQSKEQDRWKVFNSLVDCKGNPVLVSTLSKESGIGDEGKVRIVISQINKRIKTNGLSNYLKIESVGKGKSGVRGAYRITVPT